MDMDMGGDRGGCSVQPCDVGIFIIPVPDQNTCVYIQKSGQQPFT